MATALSYTVPVVQAPLSSRYPAPLPPIPATKYCKLCNRTRPIMLFPHDGRSRKDGHRWYCQDCVVPRAPYGSLKAAKAEKAANALMNLQSMDRLQEEAQRMAEQERDLLYGRVQPPEGWTLRSVLEALRFRLAQIWAEIRKYKQAVQTRYGEFAVLCKEGNGWRMRWELAEG